MLFVFLFLEEESNEISIVNYGLNAINHIHIHTQF